ncbi:hypothetical protein ACFL3H_03370 [Gemmatimonadota bacterium]
MTMESGDAYKVTDFQILPDTLTGNFYAWFPSVPGRIFERRSVAHDDIAGVELINPPDTRRRTLASIALATAVTAILVPYFQEGFSVEIRHWNRPSGSCPYLYVPDETGWTRVAELFPGAIAPSLQATDWIAIPSSARNAGRREVLLTDELQELQFLDRLAWAEVEHTPGTRVVRDCTGSFWEVGGQFPLAGERLRASSGIWRRRVDIQVPVELDSDTVLEIAVRNTWQSERVLADLLSLSEPGTVEWARRLETTPARLDRLERIFSRVAMKVSHRIRGGWEEITQIPVVGPELPRTLAIKLPSNRESDRVRLEWIEGTWELYSLATSPVIRQVQVKSIVPPASVVSNSGYSMLDLLHSTDGKYVTMAPGDTLRVSMPVDSADQTESTALFLIADGYYTRASDKNRITVIDRMISTALMDPTARKGYTLGLAWLVLPHWK